MLLCWLSFIAIKLYMLRGGRKPTYLTSATSVLTSVIAVSVVPSGGNLTDVCRENTDVGWVGFHPLHTACWLSLNWMPFCWMSRRRFIILLPDFQIKWECRRCRPPRCQCRLPPQSFTTGQCRPCLSPPPQCSKAARATTFRRGRCLFPEWLPPATRRPSSTRLQLPTPRTATWTVLSVRARRECWTMLTATTTISTKMSDV